MCVICENKLSEDLQELSCEDCSNLREIPLLPNLQVSLLLIKTRDQ